MAAVLPDSNTGTVNIACRSGTGSAVGVVVIRDRWRPTHLPCGGGGGGGGEAGGQVDGCAIARRSAHVRRLLGRAVRQRRRLARQARQPGTRVLCLHSTGRG